MPYIKPTSRPVFDAAIRDLTMKIETPGDLNYVLSRIAAGSIRTRNYDSISAAVNALEMAKLELVRRMLAPYEDKKIVENGDIPEYRVG